MTGLTGGQLLLLALAAAAAAATAAVLLAPAAAAAAAVPLAPAAAAAAEAALLNSGSRGARHSQDCLTGGRTDLVTAPQEWHRCWRLQRRQQWCVTRSGLTAAVAEETGLPARAKPAAALIIVAAAAAAVTSAAAAAEAAAAGAISCSYCDLTNWGAPHL